MRAHGIQAPEDGQSFTLSLSGLREEDARTFSDIVSVARVGDWELVDSDSFDAAVVDMSAPRAQSLLRARPLGAVVVMAVRSGAAASPGTVPLELPIREDTVWRTLDRVRELLKRRLFLLRRNRASARLATAAGSEPSRPDAAVELGSLAGLAARLRSWHAAGEQAETKLCWLEGVPFLLAPQERAWYGVQDVTIFREMRNRKDVKIRLLGGELAKAHRAGTPRRLGDFMWHLGLHAGAGELLPELDPDVALELKRWPPMLGSENRAVYFRISALLSQQPLSPRKLQETLAYEGGAVNDFINACFVTSCVEPHAAAQEKEAGPEANAEPASPPDEPKTPETTSFFGRIRSRLGKS